MINAIQRSARQFRPKSEQRKGAGEFPSSAQHPANIREAITPAGEYNVSALDLRLNS
jgi:hypothetical protein